MADVTKAEFDKLANRVHELEQLPETRRSPRTDNAIQVADDGGWFVAKGPAQADLDKLTKELHDLTVAETKTAGELHALATEHQKTATAVAQAATKAELAGLATKAELAKFEKELHELAGEHRKVADAQAVTSTQLGSVQQELHALAAKHDSLAGSIVSYVEGEGIKLETAPVGEERG